jgi:hypothetical protein
MSGTSTDCCADINDKALSTNLLQSDVEQLVPVLLARAGYDRRRFEASDGDEDLFVTLVAALETGIDLVHKSISILLNTDYRLLIVPGSPTGDPRLRLEKYLATLVSRLAPDKYLSELANST